MAHPQDAEAVDVPVSDDTDALAALENYLETEGDEDEEPDAEDEPETDEPEVEEGEDDADEPEAPAIDPPASLNADEKAAWSQLPPEAQRMIAQLEGRRTAEVQSGLEKARNAQREAESTAAGRIAEADRLHAEQLARIANAYAPQPPDPRLAEANPAAWIAQNAQYTHAKAQHDEFMQQVQAIKTAADKEAERLDAEVLQSQWRAVQSDLPEAADPAQWQALMGKLTPLALELGYPEELLEGATPVDIRAIKRAAAWKDKAEKYDALMSRQMAKVRSGKTAKPNAAQPIGSGKARASATATSRLRQSGSLDDAAAALALIT